MKQLKFLLVFGSISEPYTFFGPFDTSWAAENAASNTHAVGAGYRGWSVVPVQSGEMLADAEGSIPKVTDIMLSDDKTESRKLWDQHTSGFGTIGGQSCQTATDAGQEA